MGVYGLKICYQMSQKALCNGITRQNMGEKVSFFLETVMKNALYVGVGMFFAVTIVGGWVIVTYYALYGGVGCYVLLLVTREGGEGGGCCYMWRWVEVRC